MPVFWKVRMFIINVPNSVHKKNDLSHLGRDRDCVVMEIGGQVKQCWVGKGSRTVENIELSAKVQLIYRACSDRAEMHAPRT